jgi:zinc protease
VTGHSLVPPLGPPPRVRSPRVAERTLDSGLRVVAVRKPAVPLVELRLRVPFTGTAPTYPARATLLADTMLTGTVRRSQVELAEALQALGASLSVSVDADRLLLGGAVLSTGLRPLLDLVAEVLTGATYPADRVTAERRRLLDRIAIARSQPSVLAREALRRRLFGDHPYARELPDLDTLAAVTPAQLRRLHGQRVVPAGAVLVLVGDLSPARALDVATAALHGWTGEAGRALPRPLPRVRPGPTVLVHRPGSVQSSIRLGGAALGRDDPAYPALQLANLVFGGYFSSRLVENIREDKGYTYSPHSRIDHGAAGSTLVVEADVATDVTAPALLEIGYELGRMAALRVTQSELDDVRQYAVGSLSLSVATQAGLASTLTGLLGVGLTADWLREHPVRLAKVTVDDVAEVADRILAPSRLAAVVLGDAEATEQRIAALCPVERL